MIEAATKNSDVLIPFVMVDPWREDAPQEAQRLIDAGARGFKFHPPSQGFYANDERMYPLYEVIARADARESQARLQQARELAVLDTQSAYEELRAAQAAWEASAGTVTQAQRAYEIADLRYREGVSTQLELSDARLLLAQSQASRAQAARDLQVARARVGLLPDLPISDTNFGTTPLTVPTVPESVTTPNQMPLVTRPATVTMPVTSTTRPGGGS